MGTKIILGAFMTDFAIIIAALMYIGARNPKNPWWGSESAMTWVLPLVTGALVIGPCLLVEGFGFNFNALGSTDIAISLTILGAAVVILILMRIPKKVAVFEAVEKGEQQKGKSSLTAA